MNTRCRLMAWVLISGLAFPAAGARAQAPEGAVAGAAQPKKTFTKKNAFKLPVNIDPKDKARIREVKLFVKSGPAEPWTCKDTAPPTQGFFKFQAAQDGEYWFCVVTVDQAGKQSPADLSKEIPGVIPGLIVVVDTQPPDCELRPCTGPNSELCFYCEVKDANPDLAKTKLEYLAVDKTWQAMEPHPSQPGLFRVNNPESFKGLVRASVSDQAGNVKAKEIDLSGLTAVPAGGADNRADKVTQTQATVPGPALADPAAAASTPQLLLVNNKHVLLNYQLDAAAGVGKVDVWVTRDEGQTWQYLCEDADRCSPAELDLPGEGLYGVTMVISGGEPASPPKNGDRPDCWIEVDCTRPAAQLLAVRPVGGKEENRVILITWTAEDKNLKAEPIDLYYAFHREGPWQSLTKGLKNSGNYRWAPPAGTPADLFVRMETTDRAGNVTRSDPVATVGTAVLKPKARVIGVATPKPAAGSQP